MSHTIDASWPQFSCGGKYYLKGNMRIVESVIMTNDETTETSTKVTYPLQTILYHQNRHQSAPLFHKTNTC